MTFRVTAHRAILDWYQRDRAARSRRGPTDDSSEAARPAIAGAVGLVGPRLIFELDDRLAANLIRVCDEALASTDLTDPQRNSIEQTRKAVQLKWDEAQSEPQE